MSAQYRGLNLVLLGPPGSGKGTQAKALSECYSIPHISTGDMLRDEIRQGADLGSQAQELMSGGELVPDSLVTGIVLHRLDKEDCARGFILDGYPRNVEQAGILDGILAELGRSLERTVLISVDDEVLVRRLGGRRSCPECGRVYHADTQPAGDGATCDACSTELVLRADDREPVVRDRLTVYHQKTSPLVDYYRRRGVLVDVEGERPVARVTEALLEAIGGPAGV